VRTFSRLALLTLPLFFNPAVSSAQTQGTAMTQTATGSFDVAITPEATAPAPEGGVDTARMGLMKTFSGGLQGQAVGTMITAGRPGGNTSASYVAIDQFSGTLDGRRGGFILLHRGTMTKAGAPDLAIVIAPDSGTGALEGIAGSLSIDIRDGKHLYTLNYTLPPRP